MISTISSFSVEIFNQGNLKNGKQAAIYYNIYNAT